MCDFQKANAIDFQMRASCQHQLSLHFPATFEQHEQKESKNRQENSPTLGSVSTLWAEGRLEEIAQSSLPAENLPRPPWTSMNSFIHLGAAPALHIQACYHLLPPNPSSHTLSQHPQYLQHLAEHSSLYVCFPFRLEASRGKNQVQSLKDPQHTTLASVQYERTGRKDCQEGKRYNDHVLAGVGNAMMYLCLQVLAIQVSTPCLPVKQ